MKPVRVRLYGLVPMTRQFYLTVQAFGFGFLLIMLALTLGRPGPRFGLEESQLSRAAMWVLDHLAWIVGITIVLDGIETFFTLRQFARKEAQQRAQSL